MTAPGGLGLARVTVAAPKRRMDVALPDNLIVAELLPHLLRHAGDDLGDIGDKHGGWVLRRATGALLEPGRNLSTQGVRDGELLHLAPAREDWPELAYDDVVEVIAGGARRAGRSWGNAATRRCGLAVASVTLGLGAAVLLLSGPPWPLVAVVGLALAAALVVGGMLLARAVGDAVAGAVLAACALPYAFVGGGLLVLSADAPLGDFGDTSLLLGSAALLTVGVAGYTGVAAVQRLFMAGIAAGLTGLLAALLSLAGMSASGAAAIALTMVLGLLPGYPLIASWLGRLPVPELPDRPEEILRDRPVPKRADVFSAVARATEILTGLLLSAAVCSAVAIVFLLTVDYSTAAGLLSGAGVLALLLRARLFALPQQRIPLLASGGLGATLLLLGATMSVSTGAPRLLLVLVIALVAAAVLAAGLTYSRRTPSPYLGRTADIVDVLAIMALIPLACAVFGLFNTIRGMFASIGG
ncbi:type VII secretion integral membrane protein EccD [Plantactinospora sp. GCM10030261]|uniref:type VII secretion integral membrane protein EccD n=1 Tax=Plantactinospora sp. GCM10030261 TaxID=3273420 RepID=UPI00360C1D9E